MHYLGIIAVGALAWMVMVKPKSSTPAAPVASVAPPPTPDASAVGKKAIDIASELLDLYKKSQG